VDKAAMFHLYLSDVIRDEWKSHLRTVAQPDFKCIGP
jgi:hypothetical protein